jgi:HAD superfamily hydrolase (TIGR01509 family)
MGSWSTRSQSPTACCPRPSRRPAFRPLARKRQRHSRVIELADIVASIETRLGKPLPDRWLAQFEERRAEAFRKELKEVSGATHAVTAILASGVSICVASQARFEKSLLTLKLVGLLEYFVGNIFSASMVERGKPYPDLFLYAAKKMGHAPERCAVVEDTVLGIKSSQSRRDARVRVRRCR